MQIKRIFNNNAVMFLNKKGREEIALGKGVGYQKKIGDDIDESLVTKLFVLKDSNITQKLEQLLKDIPIEYIILATEILQEAQHRLDTELSEILIVSLSDHIYASVQRKLEGVSIKNDLLWEIKRFYSEEYMIGKDALNIVYKRFGIELAEDEAAFIVMHLINAEVNGNGTSSMSKITKVMQDICNLVRHHFHVEFDPSSVYYYRFMTHLKFFSERMLQGKTYSDEEDSELFDILKLRYINAYECTEKIRRYLKQAYNYQLSDEEESYLLIHIQRAIYKTTDS